MNHYKKLRPPQTSNKMGSRAHWHICSRLFCTYFRNYVLNLLGNPPCSLPSRPFVIAFHDQRIVVFAKLLCWATELCAERRLTVASRFHLDPGTLANHHCRGWSRDPVKKSNFDWNHTRLDSKHIVCLSTIHGTIGLHYNQAPRQSGRMPESAEGACGLREKTCFAIVLMAERNVPNHPRTHLKHNRPHPPNLPATTPLEVIFDVSAIEWPHRQVERGSSGSYFS